MVIVFQVEEDPEGGYTARALGEAIFTQADSLETLRDHIRDAVRCHFGDTNEILNLIEVTRR